MATSRLSVISAFLAAVAAPGLPAAEPVIEIGKPVATLVPVWDARGVGPLPWQGVACIALTSDGRFAAVGTIAPPGDPNVFLLSADGRVLEQWQAGQRWISEIAITADGQFVAALCTAPTGQTEDPPSIFIFGRGKGLLREIRGNGFSPLMFFYGDHSNHYATSLAAAGDKFVVLRNDGVEWTVPSADAAGARAVTRFEANRHIGPVAMAVAGSRAVTGMIWQRQSGGRSPLRSPASVTEGRPGVDWIGNDPLFPPEPPSLPPGVYGPRARSHRDIPVQATLSVAVSADDKRSAAADFRGWERRFAGIGGDRPFGFRFPPMQPTISVYDNATGKLQRRFEAYDFPKPMWCDLTFTADNRKLLAYPHRWPCRGLAGQTFLPADAEARDVYVLDIAKGGVTTLRFPDAVASVAHAGNGFTYVGCWDGTLYVLGSDFKPKSDVAAGGPGLVRVSADGGRAVVGRPDGIVLFLGADGAETARCDLNQAAKPGVKPWTVGQKPTVIGEKVWGTGGGRYHSDLGGQYVIEAPDGLILIDPNAGLSFEQNWARIKAAGLDPMKVKYVLPTHEHGDHAPGAALWRVITGAQVVASPEMAHTMQHDMPLTTGYGFHPPVKSDIIVSADGDIELAGLKLRAVRLPGHTYGSMGYVFRVGGRMYASVGDLIMPRGSLGYAGSVNFSAADVLWSLRKLEVIAPDYVLGGHGRGEADQFIAAGIRAGEATGWSKMVPEKPDPLFGFASKNYLVTAWPQEIKSADYGDIDGDGRPDVAVLAAGPNGAVVKIHFNKGGKFADAPDVAVDLPPELATATKLRFGRIAGGKAADFLVAGEQAAALLLSTDGKPKYRVVPLTGAIRATQLLAGDFTGAGRTDVLIGRRHATGFDVFPQAADGGFGRPVHHKTERIYFDLRLIDVNGDGRPDVVTAGGEIFLRRPDGTLPPAPDISLKPPEGWTWLAAGDFNGDGKADLVILAPGKAHVQARVHYNTGDPARPFKSEPDALLDLPFGGEPIRDGPTVADWNGDGIDDVVVAAGQSREVFVLFGGKGGLDLKRSESIKLDYAVHFDTKLGLADFDGDGRTDLAGFGPSSVGAQGVYILLQPGRGLRPGSPGPK